MDVRRYGFKPYLFLAMAGIAIYAIVGIVLMITADNSWRFGIDCLSDFGISQNQTFAFAFNASCIVGGILIAFLGIGKLIFENEVFNKIGGAGILIGSIAMIFVGIFNINVDKQIHDTSAAVFAAAFIIGIVFSTLVDIMKKDRFILISGIIIGLVALLGLFLLDAGGAELVGIFAGIGWSVCQFIKYRRDGVFSTTLQTSA